VYDCMILRKTVSTKLACLFHVIVNISFSYDLFVRKQQTFKNQMLESHHLISSVISPVANLARVTDWGCNCRLSILDCRILNYFSKTGKVSASDDIDNCAGGQLTAPLRHELAVLNQLFKNWMQCDRSRINKNFWNISPTHNTPFCENTNHP